MCAIVSFLRAQHPDWTKDQIMERLERDVYKSSEYTYDSRGFNEWIGYGIIQP